MKLERLDIRLITYGDDEGKYKATIKYVDEAGTVTLNLTPGMSGEMLKLCGDAIQKYSKEAAKELNNNIAESLKELKG